MPRQRRHHRYRTAPILTASAAALLGQASDSASAPSGVSRTSAWARSHHLATPSVSLVDEVHLSFDGRRVGADLAGPRCSGRNISTAAVVGGIHALRRLWIERVELHIEAERADIDQIELGAHASFFVCFRRTQSAEPSERVPPVHGKDRPRRLREDGLQRRWRCGTRGSSPCSSRSNASAPWYSASFIVRSHALGRRVVDEHAADEGPRNIAKLSVRRWWPRLWPPGSSSRPRSCAVPAGRASARR